LRPGARPGASSASSSPRWSCFPKAWPPSGRRWRTLQTSLNLGLGSALATIGLTIPAVAALSLVAQLPIALGLDAKSIVLLFLTLLVTSLSLGTERPPSCKASSTS
jgi:hypothetical protein